MDNVFDIIIQKKRYFFNLNKEEITQILENNSLEGVTAYKERARLTTYSSKDLIHHEREILINFRKQLTFTDSSENIENTRNQLIRVLQDNILRAGSNTFTHEEISRYLKNLRGINYTNRVEDLYPEVVEMLSESLTFEERVDTIRIILSPSEFNKHRHTIKANSLELKTTITKKEVVIILNSTLRGRLRLKRINGIPTFL